MLRIPAVCLAVVAVMACDDGDSDRAPDAAADAAQATSCADAGIVQHVGIASASLADSRLHFTSALEVGDDGLEETFVTKVNGLLALSWQQDRFIVPAFGGFWDIEPGSATRWVDTARLMAGVITGDVDGDGDLDALLAASGTEMSEDDGSASLFVTRVEAWERTPAGLVQRSEIWSKTPGGLLGLPFVFLDVDGDHNLDVVTFIDNELVGYFGDGAFGFRREVLVKADAELASWGAIIVRAEDRDADGVQDVLIVLGRGAADTTFRALVFLRGAGGAFMHHAPAAEFELTPSPIDTGDVTGDGLSDIVAQGFQNGLPMLRLTASTGPSTFAATTSIEPASQGVKLGDLDNDGTLDVITVIDGRLVAQLGRDGAFEQRDLGLSMTTSLLDFTVRPSEGKQPATLNVFYSVTCDPSCDDGCLDRCLDTGCPVCTTSDDCEGGVCAGGSCVSSLSPTL